MSNKKVDLLELPVDNQRAGQDKESKAHAEVIEKNLIEATLEKNKWNRSKTARELGMSLAALYRRIKKYNIRRKK